MFEDSNPHLGIYDMRIEIPVDAPKSLRNTINNHICNKGGGSTSTSGIDEEFKPDVQKGLGISRSLLETQVADPSSTIAKLDPRQQAAIDAQTKLALDKMGGRGLYDTRGAEQASLATAYGNAMQDASQANVLGSARSQKALASALAGRAGEYQKQRQEFADTGVTQLGQAGTTLQKQQQAELGASDAAVDRFFNRLTGVASKTSTTSGGGK